MDSDDTSPIELSDTQGKQLPYHVESDSSYVQCFGTAPLSVDKHLKIVREATWGLQANWWDLGVELGLSVETLEVSIPIIGSPHPVHTIPMSRFFFPLYSDGSQKITLPVYSGS